VRRRTYWWTSELIEALGALEPVWDELYPAEQARILRLLIERIDVAPDGISVTLHAAGIRSLVAELASEDEADGAMLEAADRAHGPGGRDPDDPHPDATPTPRRSEGDHDTRGGGGADAKAPSRRDAGQRARPGAPVAAADRERAGCSRSHVWRRTSWKRSSTGGSRRG
jgi:hypothetical protein